MVLFRLDNQRQQFWLNPVHMNSADSFLGTHLTENCKEQIRNQSSPLIYLDSNKRHCNQRKYATRNQRKSKDVVCNFQKSDKTIQANGSNHRNTTKIFLLENHPPLFSSFFPPRISKPLRRKETIIINVLTHTILNIIMITLL